MLGRWATLSRLVCPANTAHEKHSLLSETDLYGLAFRCDASNLFGELQVRKLGLVPNYKCCRSLHSLRIGRYCSHEAIIFFQLLKMSNRIEMNNKNYENL